MSIEALLERIAGAAERQAAATQMLVTAFAAAASGKPITEATTAGVIQAATAAVAAEPLPLPAPAVSTVTQLPQQAPPPAKGRKPKPAAPPTQTPPEAIVVTTAPVTAPTPAAPVSTAPLPTELAGGYPIPTVKPGDPLNKRAGDAIIALANDFVNGGRDAALGILKQYSATRVSQVPADKLQAVLDQAVASYVQFKTGGTSTDLI